MWFLPGFGIHPGRKVTWSKVLQVLQTRGSISFVVPIDLFFHVREFCQEEKTSTPSGP